MEKSAYLKQFKTGTKARASENEINHSKSPVENSSQKQQKTPFLNPQGEIFPKKPSIPLDIHILKMTASEIQNGSKNLNIQYEFYDSPFGKTLVASTLKGICYMAFDENPEQAIEMLKNTFPNASFQQKTDWQHENAMTAFEDNKKPEEIKLHIKGTEFQLNVWRFLLKIPLAQLTTYGNIANQIAKPGASRAVGTAIGSNLVAFIIPCHRVVQATGKFGGYKWGSTRKAAIIGWEAAKIISDS